MKKHVINGITAFLAILLFLPDNGYAECGENSTLTNQAVNDYSQFDSDTLYKLYVDNVLMNNPYMNQMDHLGYNNEMISNDLFFIESNYNELELYVSAQEESYLLFQEWIKDEDGRNDFLTKMNEYKDQTNSNKNDQLANMKNRYPKE